MNLERSTQISGRTGLTPAPLGARRAPGSRFFAAAAFVVLTLSALILGACSGAQRGSPGPAASTSASAGAATTPAAFKGSEVTFPTAAPASGTASGYLSLPADATAKHPAIIVIQEWWGLNDWIKSNADHFAGLGYVALAVDLYRGKSTSDPSVAHELMRGLPEDRAVGDLRGAFEWLAARPDVDPSKIGSVGWCMGGGYSLALAVAEPRLAAAVMNYGRLVTDKAAIAKISGPLLGNFAGKDQGISPDDVKAFEANMKSAGKTVDIKIYDGQGHAFMNPNTKSYDAAAASDAEARIEAFFDQNLKNKK